MNMDSIYYTLSAIPQIIGTIAAILTTFALFRVKYLKEYLIGDGQAVLNRWEDKGYKLPDPKEDNRQKKRLIDAIARKSILEIKEVIFELKKNEDKEGHSTEDRRFGLNNVYNVFCTIEKHIEQLIKKIMCVVIISFITIIASIVSLAITHTICLAKYFCFVLWINVFLFILSLSLTLLLVINGLSMKPEIDRKKIDQ